MLKSNNCLFSLENWFFEKPGEVENYPDNEKSLDWFLPPAPLISEIPDTQELEEEIESHELLRQEQRPKMLTPNLKITKEDTNYISPTQKIQFAFPSNKYEKDDLNLGGVVNNDLSHVADKPTYSSCQKHKNHFGSEIAPEQNVPDDTKLVNFAEDKGESISAFRKRLFKICDDIHGSAYSNDSANLESHVGSVKIVQTEMNKGKSRNYSNSKQKPQYSANVFIANDAFSASEVGETIFKAPSFSVSLQPHDIQGVTENGLGSLKAVTEIPAKFRSIFKEFPYFNYIQSKAFDDVMAPIKALCSQRFDDWKEKFGPIGLNCKELTGDTVMDDLFEIQHAHIIMTTPWKTLIFKRKDVNTIVHVVKDENRGPTLEVVVSRMKTVQSVSQSLKNISTIIPMRFVAVSATIPNAEDVS
uniref:DEAD/DEAH-box helicase domain-containing protein n=1 Tax=Propithecus coquereli TaxID=379532 RepID=A0A2K6GMR2_PROCO